MNYTLPPQQILQANGKTSIDAIRMSPNSSVLIADTTQPIVWKCVSDGLGNVTAEPYDITRHKTEEEVEKETTNNLLNDISERLKRLEFNYESIINRNYEPTNQTTYADSSNVSKPSNGYSEPYAKQPRYETGD